MLQTNLPLVHDCNEGNQLPSDWILAHSKGRSHTSYDCILTWSKAHDIGPGREPSTVVQLNELVVKLPSKHLYLYTQISAGLALYQRSFCLQ